MRRSAPRRASRKVQGPEDTAAYRLARSAVAGRASLRCEGCSRRLPLEDGHAHHRRLRSAGGKHCPSNLLWLCLRCHTWAHGHVTQSRELGWIVSGYADPMAVPCKIRDGVWWLRGNGTREPVVEGAFPLYSEQIVQPHPSEGV